MCAILHCSLMGSSNGGAVLIVDPDESIRHMIAALLGRAGFRTKSATRGGESDRQFDVIVRDVNLAPYGLERRLRELERVAPELFWRTVIITTDPSPLVRQRLAAEPFALLRKPFDVDILVETVRQCWEHTVRARMTRTQPPMQVRR